GGGLRIGEIEQAAAEQIGLQRNPVLQVRAGLNDHVGAGRAGHVETKDAAREAEQVFIGQRWPGGQAKGCESSAGDNRSPFDPHSSHSGRIISLDWLVAFHRLSRKNCAPADIELVTTKEAPETAGLAQFVQFVEPMSVELCNVQPE